MGEAFAGGFFFADTGKAFSLLGVVKGACAAPRACAKMIGRSDSTATTTASSTASTSIIGGTMLHRADLTTELCFFLDRVLKYCKYFAPKTIEHQLKTSEK